MIKDIDKIFIKSKIYKADYVYIYSDFRKIFYSKKNNPEKSVENLLNLFLKKGITCIIPSFSYSKKRFDINKTRSLVGFLGNYVLKNFEHTRSEHPIFSYIAIGKNKSIISKIGKSAFGSDSVHARLYKKNCYFLNFFRPLIQGNTLVHHIEQNNRAKYRFEKKFHTKVFFHNKYLGKNYSAFVRRNLKNESTFFTFEKTFKKIKDKKYFFKFVNKNYNLLIYPYDSFYNDLNKLYKKNNNIFIKKK
tara:strand:+ start:113 stop:853 length:741 start_codon:yes stop_codon:yes gene_type:complete